MIIDLEKVQAVLDSDKSAYHIQEVTGITRAMIGNYRKEPSRLMKMSLENALKLQGYYEEIMHKK
ncbi:hypothetical protein [Atopococcus tabaci]|uniref:hypothetical protein n=1 Tax=Atopococcus tabaci TaxID=269774 RepID=UPI002409923B|nr:hypothetical protein [Atopococcus tabaci]